MHEHDSGLSVVSQSVNEVVGLGFCRVGILILPSGEAVFGVQDDKAVVTALNLVELANQAINRSQVASQAPHVEQFGIVVLIDAESFGNQWHAPRQFLGMELVVYQQDPAGSTLKGVEPALAGDD